MSLTKASYSLITAAPINVYDYGAVGDGVANDTAALQAAVTAASGKQLWLGSGNFKITATINLPQRIRITGATNRGTNTLISAAFAGPALKYTAGSITPLEVYLEHLQVQGNASVYGAGNGIEITNGPSFNMHSCLVAGFGTNQINIGSGSYAATIRDCYIAETYGPGTSNANIYCASEYCVFDRVESDDAKFSIFLATGAYGTDIINCTLEGWANTCILVQTSATLDRNLIQGNKIIGSRGGSGISTQGVQTHIINNIITLTSGSTSILLDDNSYSSVVVGNSMGGGSTGLYVKNSGINTICNNNISGAVALDVQGGAAYPTYPQVISNNNIAGTTYSLRHNQNSKTTYVGNTFQNANTGAYLAPYFVTGTPLILASDGTNLTMSSGAMSFPTNSLVVAGGSGTNIVSVGAADSGGTGYRMLRIPN
jgi:hypothetical protein